jgi:CRP-like cAMP-binding protein
MPRSDDLQLLSRLESLSWLPLSQLRQLASSLSFSNFKAHDIIFGENEEPGRHVYVLVSGVARLTCVNTRHERVLLALIGRGVIPDLPPLLPNINFRFRFDAFSDCKIGKIRSEIFMDIVLRVRLADFRRVSANALAHWAKLFLRCSTALHFDLHERLAVALLQLGSEFGIHEARGSLLTLSLKHKDLAELVGASRQKTAEQLIRLEREHMVIRQGRQLILRLDRLEDLVQHSLVC